MSRQFWRFAVIALLGIILAGLLLYLYSMRTLERQLTAQGAEQHKTLARSLSNSLEPLLISIIGATPGNDRDALRARPEVNELRLLLRSRLEDLDVVRLKIYTLRGLTVFSTDAMQIGDDQGANPGIMHAATGIAISDIVHKDTMNTFDGVIEHRNLIQSYLPVRDAGDGIIGVFEIYSDITPLLNRIQHSQQRITAGDFSILGVFYIVMLGLYARADRAVQREQAARQDHMREIERSNVALEQQVAERTRELERSRRFLQSVMDGVSDAVLVIDTDYRVTAMNQAAHALLPEGHHPDKPLHCYRVSHRRETPCNENEVACTIREVLRTGEPYCRVHTHFLPNDESRSVEVMATPLRDDEGEITGVVEVNHDITRREQLLAELQQAKEAAEAASKEKSGVVARMCHEIRTPMNAVIGMSDLLLQTSLTRKQQEYIRVIQQSGDMLLTVVDSILDFTRVEAGALTLEKRVFDLTELLESVLEIMGYQAYSRGLELTGRVMPPHLSRMWGDSDRLRQILVNLVSNAVKSTEQGYVQVNIERLSETDQGAVMRFEVRDSGIGIDAAVRDRLFEPYKQGRGAALHGRNSTGLGLTICKQLVECMDGQIGVESEVGRGATFWFTVTLDKVAEAGKVPLLFDTRLAGRRLLAVAGHADIRDAVCHHAASWGMHCEEAADSDTALRRLTQAAGTDEPFDCAVLDVDLPGTGGVGLAQRIRENTGTVNLPLVLLSSVARPLSIGTVTALNRARCIHKPLLPSRLFQNLQAAMAGEGPGRSDNVNAAEGDVAQPGIRRDRARILVAEDNTFNTRLLLDMLETLGFHADSVSDGPAVMQAVQQTPYDLILMDCHMPGLDGREVARLIRGYGTRLPKQPLIVALSADVTLQHQQECLQAGMNEFIGKPLRLEKLAAGLQRWLPAAVADARTPQTRAGPSCPPAVLEEVHLKGVAGNHDREFMDRYLSLFMEDARARLKAMDAAIRAGQYEQVQRHAHALKGSCLHLGVRTLGDRCETLRKAAASGDAERMAASLRRLQSALDTSLLSSCSTPG